MVVAIWAVRLGIVVDMINDDMDASVTGLGAVEAPANTAQRNLDCTSVFRGMLQGVLNGDSGIGNPKKFYISRLQRILDLKGRV